MIVLPEDVEGGDPDHISHHNTIHGQHNLLGFLTGQALKLPSTAGWALSDYTTQPAGDLDVRMLIVNPVVPTDGVDRAMAYPRVVAEAADTGWRFSAYDGTNGTDSTLRLTVVDDDVVVIEPEADPITWADRVALWVRAVLDIDNGASGWTVTFYTSADGSNWDQLGSPVTDTPAMTWPTSTAALKVGTPYSGGGWVQKAEVRFGGSLVANPYFDASPWIVGDDVDDAHDDGQGNTWTLADLAEITSLPEEGDLLRFGSDGRFEGAAPSALGLVVKESWMAATTLDYSGSWALSTSAMGADAKAVGDFLGTLFDALINAGLVTYTPT